MVKKSTAAKDKAVEKKMSPTMRKKDAAMDKKMGVKEGSTRDLKMDTKMLNGAKKKSSSAAVRVSLKVSSKKKK